MSHVCIATTHTVVSQSRAPPVVSGGHIPASGGHVITFRMYIPTYGVSHGASHVMTYGPYCGMQYGQGSSPYGYGYQQPTYSRNYGFVAPNIQGTPHYGASMPPYTSKMGGGNYGQGHGGNQTYLNQNYHGAVH